MPLVADWRTDVWLPLIANWETDIWLWAAAIAVLLAALVRLVQGLRQTRYVDA